MAKKKQELTMEEKLMAALVREDEQPYKVPANWVWTRLDYMAEYKKGPFGSAVTKAMFIPKSKNTFKVYEQGVAIRKDINYGNYYISEEKYNELKSFKIDPGDLIVSCAGTVGETFQLPDVIEPGIINQALMRIKVKPEVNLKYFLMYFDEILREDITGKSKGTAIKNIPPFSVLKKMPYPLPPLAEQQRIVDRIESLFDQLDQAKALIQEALDSFETRKAAILHQAFTGALTKKWREEHGVGMESWEEKTIGDIADVKGGKRLPKGNNLVNENTGYPYIRAGDLKNGTVQLEKIQYLTPEIYEKIKNYTVATGDVYVTIVGACIGDVGVVPESADGANLTENAAKITNITCESKYLGILMASNIVQSQIRTRIASATLGKLSLQNIKLLEIKIPCLPEQHEIVRILDDLFAKEQNAQDLCDLIDQIDIIKKTILGKAFRGELGTNVAGEESAVELLKSIL